MEHYGKTNWLETLTGPLSSFSVSTTTNNLQNVPFLMLSTFALDAQVILYSSMTLSLFMTLRGMAGTSEATVWSFGQSGHATW